MKQTFIAIIDAVVSPIFVAMRNSNPTRPIPLLAIEDGGMNTKFSRREARARENRFRERINKKVRG